MNKTRKSLIIVSLILVGALFYYSIYMGGSLSDENSPQNVNKTISGLPSLSATAIDQTPDIIRSIDLALVSKKTRETYKQIRDIVPANNGIIGSSDITGNTDKNYSGTIDISIPQDKIKPVLDAISHMNVSVDSERTSTQDVAAQRIDLQSRLQAAQDLESKYLLVLKTAKSVDDVVAVTDRLTDVRRNIEALTQQQYILNQQLSHINIRISLNSTPVMIATKQVWKPYHDVVNAAHSLLATMQWLVDAGIWLLVYVLPLAVIFSGIYFIFNRLLRGRLRRM
jgi:hypothetical protein